MYNLHCHSLLSDGCLLPSEVAVRFQSLGYKVIAITDHVDYSTIHTTIKSIKEFCLHWPKNSAIKILPGIELTHVPLEQFKPLTVLARKEGIKIIIGHGETTAEPMTKGTNRACLESDIDILAHPGSISLADTLLAKEKGIFLEITARPGHRNTNSHVVSQALKSGANLILNIDSHDPDDIIAPSELKKYALKAGLTEQQISAMYEKVRHFLVSKGVK